MKRLPIGLLILGFSTLLVAAQDQVIDHAAFNAGLQRHLRPPAEWQGISRRVTNESWSTYSKTPLAGHRRKVIAEYNTERSFRRIFELDACGKITKADRITVGTKSFSRMNGGRWKPYTPKHPIPQYGVLYFEATDDRGRAQVYGGPGSMAEFRVSTAEHAGKSVLVYTKILRKKKVDPSDNSEIDSEHISKYWVSTENGRMVKTELLILDRGKDFENRKQHIWEWEADPSIVIKAPISGNEENI